MILANHQLVPVDEGGIAGLSRIVKLIDVLLHVGDAIDVVGREHDVLLLVRPGDANRNVRLLCDECRLEREVVAIPETAATAELRVQEAPFEEKDFAGKGARGERFLGGECVAFDELPEVVNVELKLRKKRFMKLTVMGVIHKLCYVLDKLKKLFQSSSELNLLFEGSGYNE